MGEVEAIITPEVGNEGFESPHVIHKPARKRKRTCDRLLPCSNCITRSKQSHCHYENEPATKRQPANDATTGSSEDEILSPDITNTLGVQNIKLVSEGASQLNALGYSKADGHNTLAFIEKIESLESDNTKHWSQNHGRRPDYDGLREKYKSLVRQLPPKAQLEILLETFFSEINYIYSSVNKEIFMEYLEGWNKISFSVLSRGPQEIQRDLRYFPALFFQVLALALQFQPPEYDRSLNALRYAPEMSLDDLAADYSENGAALLALLPKRDLTISGVQAGFLRTSFLKNNGSVVESWHSLGQTIRDAQEIGIHKDRLDIIPKSPEQAREVMWQLEDRRRMWMALQMWDAHMALVLGRPTSIDPHTDKVIYPVDVPLTRDRRHAAPVQRSSSDPPTPLTALIASCVISIPLRDVLDLQKEGAYPKDYAKVEQIHQDILQRVEDLPPPLRPRNPDTTFDSNPNCKWLPVCRATIESNWNFCVMNLHRPYVFTIPKSRTEALKGALGVLQAHLVFSTFDACVLLAAVYILHPKENLVYLDTTLQHIDWARERFEIMSDRSPTARAALGVLRAVQVRLRKAIGCKADTNGLGSGQIVLSNIDLPKESPASTTSSSNLSQPFSNGRASAASSSLDFTFDGNASSENKAGNLSLPDGTDINGTQFLSNPTPMSLNNIGMNSVTTLTSFPMGLDAANPNWNTSATDFLIPDGFDFSSMEPLQPMRDLVFNDLVGMSNDPEPTMAANAQTFYDASQPWQFEGEFQDDSFWNFMNQYNP